MSALTVSTETITFPELGETVTLDIASLDAIHWHVLIDGQDAGCYMDAHDARIGAHDILAAAEGLTPAEVRALRGPACWLASANR